MKTHQLPRAALDLLAHQDQVATTVQLRNAGVSKETVRWNAGRAWHVLLPRVVVLGRDTPTERQRLIGALLWAGPNAYVADANAASFHGITSAARKDSHIDMRTPYPHATRHKGFASVQRTELTDHDIRTVGPLRYASPAGSAIGAAVRAPRPADREAILIEAVQRRVCTIDELAEWAFRLRPRDTARIEAALEAAGSGVWSLPEADLLELVSRSVVLPNAVPNPALAGPDGRRLITPDLWFDDVAMAVMVHSHRQHSQGEDWDKTVERDGELTSAGVVVVGVTPTSLRRRPGVLLDRIEQTYRVAQARPRPNVVAVAPTGLAS